MGSFSLPSATKLRRLCFYKRLSVHWGGGGVPEQVLPRPGTPPQARYTPRTRYPPGTRYTPPGPGTRYTPRDQVHPPDPTGPGTQPRTRYTPPRYVHCCGWYASYWNAFLLNLSFIVFLHSTITDINFVVVISLMSYFEQKKKKKILMQEIIHVHVQYEILFVTGS